MAADTSVADAVRDSALCDADFRNRRASDRDCDHGCLLFLALLLLPLEDAVAARFGAVALLMTGGCDAIEGSKTGMCAAAASTRDSSRVRTSGGVDGTAAAAATAAVPSGENAATFGGVSVHCQRGLLGVRVDVVAGVGASSAGVRAANDESFAPPNSLASALCSDGGGVGFATAV